MAGRRWNALVQATNHILWVSDPTGTFSDRRGWSAFTGLAASQLNEATWFSFVHPDDRQFVQARWSQAVVAQTEYLVECRVRRVDGVYRTFVIQGIPVRNDDGTLREWAGIATDITELRQAEAERDAALQREQHLRASQLIVVLDAAVDGIVIYHPDGSIMHQNPAFRAMMGYDLDSTFDQRPFPERMSAIDVRDCQGRAVPLADLPPMRVLRGERITAEQAFDLHMRALDGREIILNATGAPVRDANGVIVSAVVVYRDVTAQRQAAREQEQMVHVVSHELNTPLTSLKTRAQFMRRHMQRGLVLTDAEFALLEGDIDRLARLVTDLVDSGRIDARHLPLDRQPCDLANLCAAVVASQQAMTQRAVDFTVTPGTYTVLADSGRIEQVLANLIGNALKYAPPPAPVRVALERAGAHLRVSVQDAGPGITLADQARIFDRFFRVTSLPVHTGSAVGLGLGLYLCRHIVEQHGGTIGVTSAPGQGTTFWFTLPTADA